MRAVDIIIKKRDHGELTREEIEFFMHGFTKGEIPDYQAAAWAMAVLLNGMTPRETTDLTLAMAHSGEVLDLSRTVEIAVDKHSTGGVGDKTTLVVEPTVAACGLPVGKMSGRGLGFSGGTLDKIQSIPGFRVDLSIEEFLRQLKEIGLVLAGQSAELAPADGKLYGLRDVTGTVQSIPLIASSIMSKKIAAGAQAILLDVKVGNGAFMQDLDSARTLSHLMVNIAHLAERKATALLSDMNQPLGYAVGNALELKEAIDTLHAGGPLDFREHCLEVAAYLLVLGGRVETVDQGKGLAQKALEEGKSWERFRELVIAQGGDVSYIDQPEKLPTAHFIKEVPSPRGGYLQEINARIIGETAVFLGAGRERKNEPIDPGVGIVIHNKVGDEVRAGEFLFTIYANQDRIIPEASHRILSAYCWSDQPVAPLPLFYGVIE